MDEKRQTQTRARKLYHRRYYLERREEIIRRTVVYNRGYNKRRQEADKNHAAPSSEWTCDCCGRPITEANAKSTGKGPTCAAGLCQCQ